MEGFLASEEGWGWGCGKRCITAHGRPKAGRLELVSLKGIGVHGVGFEAGGLGL